MSAEESPITMNGFSCPIDSRDASHITMEHGAGGRRSEDLLQRVFWPLLQNEVLDARADAAVFSLRSGRVAMSTDSFVVRPLFFPGGSIGHLAVNGTVNDLAMMGARAKHLTAGFILEEGLGMQTLRRIVEDMADAARRAGVTVVAGDTKVVERGHGDGCYINTAGVGEIAAGIDIAPSRARPGDAVVISGPVGNHGMAIMSVREGLEFDTEITSDCAPLNGLVMGMIEQCADIHVLRDPTRGGLAASLNEIASASNCGIVIEEERIPVDADVSAACEMLGLDPFHVANEGKLVCIVPADSAAELLSVMRSLPQGRQAVQIGSVVNDHPGMVVARTAIGGTRVVALPSGEPLPRIC